MSEIDPITREEVLLNSIAEGTGSDLEPKTRQEHYLSAIAGETDLPAKMQEEGPRTREEIYYQKILDNGGGGGEATGTKNISITENGVTTHNIKAYATAEITTNVPNSYDASDEGKVVDDGALVAQTSATYTENDTYDTTLVNEVVVNVPTGVTPTGTLSIKKDGTYNVANYASVEVKTAMEKVNVTGTTVAQELAPNKFYVFGEVTSLTITLGTGDSDLANDYHFRFTSGSTATVLSLPQTVNMPTGFVVEASKVYEISIVDNYGTVTSWA